MGGRDNLKYRDMTTTQCGGNEIFSKELKIMIEQRFLEMLQKCPGALESKQRFSGMLKDCFPKEPVIVNLVVLLYEMGLHTEIENAERVNRNLAYRFANRLVSQYGTDRQNAENVVRLFCVCYGTEILGKPCELEKAKQVAENNTQNREQVAPSNSPLPDHKTNAPAQPVAIINPKKPITAGWIIFWLMLFSPVGAFLLMKRLNAAQKKTFVGLILIIIAVLIVALNMEDDRIAQDFEGKTVAVANESLAPESSAAITSTSIISTPKTFDKNWTRVYSH